jgi:pimeloyl-ACP methyl ester carboxylesterase
MRLLISGLICPVLVIQGEDDQYATPQHAIDIAEAIPRARVWLIPGGAHMVPQENANQFNLRLLQFLRQPESIYEWQVR